MLKVTLLEFFVRGIPEAFLFILAAHAFSKSKIHKNRYILSSLLYNCIVYTIRLLPIQYGIHSVLNVFVLIVLNVNLNKINLIKTIQASIITILLQFMCEGINVLIIQHVFKADMNYIFNEPVLKTLYGLPAVVIFACIVILYYIRLKKRKELNFI